MVTYCDNLAFPPAARLARTGLDRAMRGPAPIIAWRSKGIFPTHIVESGCKRPYFACRRPGDRWPHSF